MGCAPLRAPRGVKERLLRRRCDRRPQLERRALPLTLSRQLAVGEGTAAANSALLALLAERVGRRATNADALLLVTPALLAGLVRSLGAFPLRLPLAAPLPPRTTAVVRCRCTCGRAAA